VNRALFLDRDGVLDHLVFYPDTGEWESPRRLADLRLIDGAADAVRRAHADGWLIVVVTNQPSYAKGKTSLEDLAEIHAAVMKDLPVAKSCVCHHHPDAIVDALRVKCDCRKPGTGSLRDAAKELDIDLSRSWMAGDQDTDLRAGRAAGCRVALVDYEPSAYKRGAVEPDLRVRNLEELVERVRVE
jgi:D-glycero-D-manno-heptose 1,7-bisphosphate phosphatase